MEKAIDLANTVVTLTQASETLTHERIIKRGIIQSVVRYFYDKSAQKGHSPNKIDLLKIDNEYYKLDKLYKDYYGVHFCRINLRGEF